MVDDVLINKAATIERCVLRAKEEYANWIYFTVRYRGKMLPADRR